MRDDVPYNNYGAISGKELGRCEIGSGRYACCYGGSGSEGEMLHHTIRVICVIFGTSHPNLTTRFAKPNRRLIVVYPDVFIATQLLLPFICEC